MSTLSYAEQERRLRAVQVAAQRLLKVDGACARRFLFDTDRAADGQWITRALNRLGSLGATTSIGAGPHRAHKAKDKDMLQQIASDRRTAANVLWDRPPNSDPDTPKKPAHALTPAILTAFLKLFPSGASSKEIVTTLWSSPDPTDEHALLLDWFDGFIPSDQEPSPYVVGANLRRCRALVVGGMYFGSARDTRLNAEIWRVLMKDGPPLLDHSPPVTITEDVGASTVSHEDPDDDIKQLLIAHATASMALGERLGRVEEKLDRILSELGVHA